MFLSQGTAILMFCTSCKDCGLSVGGESAHRLMSKFYKGNTFFQEPYFSGQGLPSNRGVLNRVTNLDIHNTEGRTYFILSHAGGKTCKNLSTVFFSLHLF